MSEETTPVVAEGELKPLSSLSHEEALSLLASLREAVWLDLEGKWNPEKSISWSSLGLLVKSLLREKGLEPPPLPEPEFRMYKVSVRQSGSCSQWISQYGSFELEAPNLELAKKMARNLDAVDLNERVEDSGGWGEAEYGDHGDDRWDDECEVEDVEEA